LSAAVARSRAEARSLRDTGVPTADYAVFDDLAAALAHVRCHPLPVVVKASGLSLGKGVFICGAGRRGAACGGRAGGPDHGAGQGELRAADRHESGAGA
jgi:phosphoribosylamine-glycine ligase